MSTYENMLDELARLEANLEASRKREKRAREIISKLIGRMQYQAGLINEMLPIVDTLTVYYTVYGPPESGVYKTVALCKESFRKLREKLRLHRDRTSPPESSCIA